MFPAEACTKSWSYYTSVPEKAANKEPCLLGVDEAGRGPVLGSMVYAVAYCPIDFKEDLAKREFADSKVLKPEQREDLFEKINKENNWIGWGVHACSPQDISENMLRRNKYNLNALAHDTTIGMIQHVLDQGVNITEIYVDTVGDPDKYQQKLTEIFPGIDITVAKKADSLYKIVSAASICAKVTRDFSMKDWKFIEKGLDLSFDFGSGYPSDPNTKEWMENNFDSVFGFPRVIRFSWSTAGNYIESKGVAFTWEEEENDPDQPTITDMWCKSKATNKRDDVYARLGFADVVGWD